MARAKKESTNSIISRDAVADYVTSDVKTPSGRKSVDCDDATARKMRGLDAKGLEGLCRDNGLLDRWNGTGDFKEKTAWKDLNAGQSRMAVGNALRAIERNGGKAKVKAKAKPAKKAKKAAKKKAA